MKRTVIRRVTEEIVIEEDMSCHRCRSAPPDPYTEDEIAVPIVIIPERFPRGYRKPQRAIISLFRPQAPPRLKALPRLPALPPKTPKK